MPLSPRSEPSSNGRSGKYQKQYRFYDTSQIIHLEILIKKYAVAVIDIAEDTQSDTSNEATTHEREGTTN